MSAKKSIQRRKASRSMATQYHRTILARRLDMLADFELQAGHHAAAERLAWRAAELREAVR
jgi:hypothetical protein